MLLFVSVSTVTFAPTTPANSECVDMADAQVDHLSTQLGYPEVKSCADVRFTALTDGSGQLACSTAQAQEICCATCASFSPAQASGRETRSGGKCDTFDHPEHRCCWLLSCGTTHDTCDKCGTAGHEFADFTFAIFPPDVSYPEWIHELGRWKHGRPKCFSHRACKGRDGTGYIHEHTGTNL